MVEKRTGDGDKPALPDAVLKGLRGVGGDVAYTAPSAEPLGLEEALRNIDASWRADASLKPTSLSLVAENNVVIDKEEQLERRKAVEIARVQQVLNATSDPDLRGELRELIEKISQASSLSALKDVLQDVSKKVAEARGSADDKVVDISAMHKELYASDAVYRAKVNEITAQATVLMEDAAKRREASDKIAVQYGITTNYDNEMSALTKDYAGLDPQSEKARAIEIKMLEIERKQNDERIKELRAKGLAIEADKLEKQTPKIEDARKKAEELYRQQLEAFLEAYEQSLVNSGSTKGSAELKALVKDTKEKYEGYLSQLNQDADVGLILKKAEELGDLSDLRRKYNRADQAKESKPEVSSPPMKVTDHSNAELSHMPSPQTRIAKTESQQTQGV